MCPLTSRDCCVREALLMMSTSPCLAALASPATAPLSPRASDADPSSPFKAALHQDEKLKRLEEELAAARAELASKVGELEAAREEKQSAEHLAELTQQENESYVQDIAALEVRPASLCRSAREVADKSSRRI